MKMVRLGGLAVVVLFIARYMAYAWWGTSLPEQFRIWMTSRIGADLETSMDIELLLTATACLLISTRVVILSIKACRYLLRRHPADWLLKLRRTPRDVTFARLGGMAVLILGTGVSFFVCFGTRQAERDTRTMAGLDPGLSWEGEYLLALFVGLLVSMVLIPLLGWARRRYESSSRSHLDTERR